MGFFGTFLLLDFLQINMEKYEYYSFDSMRTFTHDTLLVRSAADKKRLSALEHASFMKRAADNDAINLLMLAFEVRDMSHEFSQHLAHLAHLKYPDLVGGNSSLQVDFSELGSELSVQMMAEAADL